MKPLAIVLSLGLIFMSHGAVCAVEVGDKAPQFEATDDTGKAWNSADHIGKGVVVVYFFPADLTGGCTKQACGFRDDMEALKAKGIDVVGISGDSVQNHQLFKKIKNLNFTLLADEKGEIAKAFGVPVGRGGTIKYKDSEGKSHSLTRGVSTKRWTFVIDKQGKIAFKNTKVNPGQDSKNVMSVVQKLK